MYYMWNIKSHWRNIYSHLILHVRIGAYKRVFMLNRSFVQGFYFEKEMYVQSHFNHELRNWKITSKNIPSTFHIWWWTETFWRMSNLISIIRPKEIRLRVPGGNLMKTKTVHCIDYTYSISFLRTVFLTSMFIHVLFLFWLSILKIPLKI